MKGTNKFWLLKAAGALIIGMALLTGLVGCKTDDDDDEGGGSTAASPLVAKWYDTQANATADGTTGLKFTFKADGSFVSQEDTSRALKFTAENGKITLVSAGGSGSTKGSANYSIAGTALTLTNYDDGGYLENGTFYKKAE